MSLSRDLTIFTEAAVDSVSVDMSFPPWQSKIFLPDMLNNDAGGL